jgi:formylglycine-generating enzyme required for sulfatase activity
VWEWVQAGPSSGSGRVNRGGCWGRTARYCHSAYRFYGAPGDRDGNLGFRLLRVAQ